MKHRIQKVAVLGSGVMGSGIACHFANIGLQVLMLDMPPKDEAEKNRSIVADTALKTAIKSKPAPLYDKAFVSRITTGNFDDDLAKIEDCDWVIEVIVERADIKQGLFEKVEKHRRPGTLITSNTSGIPISILAEGRSEDFQQHFCGTHFFNPARYMSLLEIIPHGGTSQEVTEFFMEYGSVYLGKKTVLCKDTPAFIANRIGFFSGNKITELTTKHDLTIVEVDKLTGAAIGWPSTGSYRLLDLVGLDTSVKVTKGVMNSCPNDEYVQKLKDIPTPRHTEFLLENGWYGNKSGQGYYKKTNERDANGKRIILALDLNTLEYKPTEKPNVPVLKVAKKIEMMDKRLQTMVESEDKGGQFLAEYFAGLFAYCANRIHEISDNIYSVDDAMKAGYAWGFGPFEYWDMIGFEKGLELIAKYNLQVPEWVEKMKSAGVTEFYKIDNEQKVYFDLDKDSYEVLPSLAGLVHLDNVRGKTPVYKNSEATLHDIGDGVMCLEFTSKSNVIGVGTGEAVTEALRIAEDGDWKGIVIGNNAKNFSVGANLMAVGMHAMQGQWDELEQMVAGFQGINMAMRYSKVPVVTATQGYVFGGGIEIGMHTDSIVAGAESYIGLVEVGVGLLPGGGGTKEFAKRASDSYFEGDVQIPTLIEKLKTIATAAVATSAHEAYNLGYMDKTRDEVCVSTERVLSRAKEKVQELSVGYVPPVPAEVMVLGRNALSTLYTAINEFYLGKYMSEYDVEISRKIAYVLCGGDLTSPQNVSEQYLLEIEKEAFLQLLGNQKTQERIQYMLMNNKPLRN